jgi:eukaryotic-like serine/threonine-protein kinase
MVGRIISHYKILEILGSGGMGIVYKAEDIKLHRTVALKFLPTDLTTDKFAKDRFIREAQAASSLQHNNICTIHEIDETKDGQFYISMDYYEGETLKSKMSIELLSIDEIIALTTQIAEGLNRAHEKGIIHRDIKPANVFITKEGIVKILDFGLAKKLDQTQITKMGMRFGSTEYMSPEQIKGENVDHRTDIWSLGIILYEMLTGQQPFKADYEQAIIYLILNQEPENAGKFREDIPEILINILNKSVAKDRGDRYEDLELMIDDLRKVMDEKEIQSYQFELPLAKPSNSIAVLPFVNMSTDPEQEIFCDGLTEELINALSKISDLRVVARTSAFAMKGGSYDTRYVGRKLGVRTILEGSVRKSGNRLRITAQLINVVDGYHLWSERYDHDLTDIFDLQDEITLSIVDVLKVKILEEEKENLAKRYTDNIEAYNLYMQGRYLYSLWNVTMFDKAIEYFNKALEKDPNFAPAYIGLAISIGSLGYFGVNRNREVNTWKYIQKALEIDDGLSEAYDALGLNYACFEWKWTEAQSALQRSLELNPNNVMALGTYIFNRVSWSEFDLARKLFNRAKEIDPVSYFIDLCGSIIDFCSNKINKAAERLYKFLDTDPPFWWGLWFLWRSLSFENRKKEAVEACRKSFLVAGANQIAEEMEKAGIDNAFQTAAGILSGIYEHHYSSPYDIAILFSHSGNQGEALNWIEKAVEERDPKLHFINVDPEWQSIRNYDRFQKCLKIIGFIK